MKILSTLFPRFRPLGHFFLLSYVVVLANTAAYLRGVNYTGVLTAVFVAAVYLSYCAAYLLPAFVLALGADLVVSRRFLEPLFRRARWLPGAVAYGVALLGFGTVQVLLFADKFIYGLYDFHLNGFVWNLVTTKGGIQSLGGDTAAMLTFGAVVLGFYLLEGAVLAVLLAVPRVRKFCARIFHRWVVAMYVGGIIVLALFQGVAYGICSLTDYVPVLVTADAFPFYQPTTFRHLAGSLGFQPAKRETYRVQTAALSLNYPLKPIVRTIDHPKYNVVWLVAESLRADMLDADIMPATWSFAQKATRFTHHYSAGNGTRMAMFGMFYGLYGNYWFSFLRERQGPVLFDTLLADHYQMNMYTSAAFTYPEFDRTIFARIPPEELHQCNDNRPGWQWDRINVGAMLTWLDGRDPQRPFFTFMFFESPHARYYFPPENAIRTPYLEDFNYATMNLQRDIGLIWNRYVNSCNHLDSQLARIIDYLGDHKLLDSTIVIITSDHGEEFMEKGHWGHNSTFSEEQTRTPLVVYVPGRAPAVVTRMTSHLDLPATVLPLLGVANPAEDYSLGYNLFGSGRREYCILGSWTTLAYIDADYKAVFSTKSYGGSYGGNVTTAVDRPVADAAAFSESRQKQLLQVMADMKRFSR